MLVFSILLGSTGTLAIFVWLAVMLIFNPGQLGWLNKFLPEWAKISDNQSERPQTLLQIKEKLKQESKIAGEIFLLSEDATQSFLLPIFQKRANCQSDCDYIIELRVYQQAAEPEFLSEPEKHYSLTAQLPVQGPPESFVVAPLLKGTTETPGTDFAMPLNEIKRFESGTPSGIWFYLRGQRSSATGTTAYGHIVHYYPERSHLKLMLPWTSTTGQTPQWQQVTGGGTRELIVNQTVGLEPQLEIYQVQPAKLVVNPIQLEPISLQSPALQDSAFQGALSIARSGLWTSAYEWLEFIKKQRQGKLPAKAQAQMDFIRLHSQISKTQANTTWASPSQEVLADLIDGRWAKALQVFEASPENALETASLLKAVGGRLMSRVEAALEVNRGRPEVQAWGALILAARYNPERANYWLKTQPKISQDNLEYTQTLLKQLRGEVVKPKVTANNISRIIGTVLPVGRVEPKDWLHPKPVDNLQKTDTQSWYQVTVTAFHNGETWLYFPFKNLKLPETSPGKFLWDNLGINNEQTIQIVLWLPNGEQHTAIANIKGVQLRGENLLLLVAAEQTHRASNSTVNNQPRSLALSSSALEWVQPSPMTVDELYQQDSKKITTLLPKIWRSLQPSGQISSDDIPNIEALRQQMGHWPVQSIDLTGNNQPEKILTISPEAIASLNKTKNTNNGHQKNFKGLYRPRTVILSDTGNIVYTDFIPNTRQSLIAIAKLSEQQSLSLLIENADAYALKRWSSKSQRFE